MSMPYGQNSNCPPTVCPCQCAGAESNASSSCCGGTLSGAGCGCGGGSSVLLSAGAFSFRRSLLSLAAVNKISWEFGLDYLAGNGVDDILGKGFNYPQNLRLVAGGGGDVILAGGQNTLNTFVPAGGGYTADSSNCTQAELSHAGGLFTLTASDGTVSEFYDFDSPTPGRLKSITDRYGNRQTYAWQPMGTLCQLTSVTDAYGRAIQYSYHGAEFGYCLKQITDFLGRRLNFQYDGLGHLVAVVLPSVLRAAAGNAFPGGTAYVFQYDVNNPRPDRRDDLVRIWFPNEAAPFVDADSRTVNVDGVYASATPRYVVQYGQDPTDAEMYGRVVQETVGEPANGVGGTYQYLYTTSGLPAIPFPDDAADAIVFRCVLTDRNDNQTVYDFNAAQMPVRVEVMRSRGKIDVPSTPASFVTWTAYNSQNQPTVKILPAGNSVEYSYENGQIPGLPSTYNRRVGLLTSRTEYPGNTLDIPSRPGSNGQSQLTETFFYEPIFNQVCARVERRGNPIGGPTDYFSPQNGGAGASAARYATITCYDYQKDAQSAVAGDGTLQTLLGLSQDQINSLYTFVNGQLSAASLPLLAAALGDVNGDGTGSGAAGNAPHLGNVVMIQHPTVTLINPDPNTELTTQARVEVFTSNNLGQTTTHTDPNGNLTVYIRYPYNDPEGNGGATEPVSGIPAGFAGKQYGRMKEIHVDADPSHVLSLVGADGDLGDFIPADIIANAKIVRYNAPGVYQDLVTRYEGGSGAAGSGCAACAYDPMGNPLAVTDPRGFTTRYDRNELGEVYRTISPQPYNFRVETYYDANRNVTRVDTEDQQPAFSSADPTSALFAQFTPSGSGNAAHVPMRPGPGGSLRPGWFTNLYSFDLLDEKIEEDIDATGSSPANLVTTFLYDPNQNLIQVTKPEGNIVEYDYDERNLRIATRVGRDAASGEPGAVTVTAFDANGNLLQVIGPASRGGTSLSVAIEDAFRGGATLTHTGDLAVSNTYDGFDRVIKAVDALGNYVDTGAGYTTDPFLDPDGRVVRSDNYGTLGDGTTALQLLASSKARFDEAGRQYEAQRQVFIAAGTTLPSGRTVTHNGGGLVPNSTANDNTGATTISTAGQVSYVLTRTLFDAGGRTIAVLADNAAQTTMFYDGADRRTSVADAMPGTMQNVVSNTFDAAGNLIGVKRSEKCTISTVSAIETFSSAMFYDCLNRLVLRAEQGPDGTLSTDLVVYSNGPFWQLSNSTLVTCLGYDSRGNQVLSIDPKGNSAITVFDGASRAIQTQQHLRQAGQGQNPPVDNQTLLPAGGACVVTTMILDGNGRQIQLVDDRGGTTLFAYDTMDREVTMTFQDGSTRTNVYDEADDVVLHTDENGSQFINTFDALGRKVSVDIVVAEGVSPTTQSQSFQHDGLSRMTSALNSNERLASQGYSHAINSTVTLIYDSLGRVVEEAQANGGQTRCVTNTAFTSYPVTEFQFPDSNSGAGRTITNAYDPLYRRTQVEDGSDNIASWSFFGPSRVAEVQLGNGLTCTWMNNARTNSAAQPSVSNPSWASGDFLGYDGAGRMTAKRYLAGGVGRSGYSNTAAPVVGFSTGYDRAGNKLYEQALHAPDRSSLYEPFVNGVPQGGYDSLNRLLQYQRGVLSSGGDSIASGGAIAVPGTDTQRTYVLDGLGNWRQTSFAPVGESAQTEIRQHNGLNQITRIQDGSAQTDLAYDKNGNVTFDGTLSYTWDALNRLVAGGSSANYVYDALNRRVRKSVGGAVTDCLYSGWRCVEDRNSNDFPIVQYVWGIYLDELIQQTNLAAINGFAANAVFYPLQDLLYRTTGLTDSSGNIMEAYDTDAYGNTLIFRASPLARLAFSDSDRQVTSPTCAFIFTGQRFDSETGLYYYKRRYYLPGLGRFFSRDPIGYDASDVNLYRYVANGPVTFTDPTGTWRWFGWVRPWPCCNGVKYDPDNQCCENNAIVNRVPIWICNRPLDISGHPYVAGTLHTVRRVSVWYAWSLSHTYVCCAGENLDCYGMQYYNLTGSAIPKEMLATGSCGKHMVCPSVKTSKCVNPISPWNFSKGLGRDCHGWAWLGVDG